MSTSWNGRDSTALGRVGQDRRGGQAEIDSHNSFEADLLEHGVQRHRLLGADRRAEAPRSGEQP